MSNLKENRTRFHKVKCVGPGIFSIVGIDGGCTILTEEEIDQIHALKEANRK